jgi:hypothetical protein
MIVFITGCDARGHDFATHGSRRAASAAALARSLVSAGAPDQPWESYTPTGTRSLFGPSLHALARLSADESSMRWRRYRPFTGTLPATTGATDPAHAAGRGRPISAPEHFPDADTGTSAGCRWRAP